MMHWNETLVVALGAMIGVLLIVVAVVWRRMVRENPGLPIWRFLRRSGITRDDAANAVSARTAMQAELRCAVCGGKTQCLQRLAAGDIAAPLAHCPNARFFDEFGLRVAAGDITNARLLHKPKPALDFTHASRSKGPKPAL